MYSKNNQHMINRKKQQKINYYGIKKFKIGAASVMIAAGFVFLGGSALANNSNDGSTSTGDVNRTTEVSNDKPQGTPAETPKANGEETGQPAANAPKDESSGTSANNVAKEQKATIKFTSVDPKTKEETDIEKIGEVDFKIIEKGKSGELVQEGKLQSRILALTTMGYEVKENPFLKEFKPKFDEIDDTENNISQVFTIKVSPKVSTAKKVYVSEGELPTVDEIKNAITTDGKVLTSEAGDQDKDKQLTDEKIKSSIPTTIGKVGDETLKVPTTVIYGAAPFKREESVDVDVRVLPKITEVTTTVVKNAANNTVIDSILKDVNEKLKTLNLPDGITASVKQDDYAIPAIDSNGEKKPIQITVEYKDSSNNVVAQADVDVKVKVVSSTTEKKVVLEGEKLTADEVKKAVKPSEENAEIKEPKNLDTITKEAGEKEIEVPVSYDNGKLTETAKVKLTVLPKPLPQGVVAQKNGDKESVKKRVIEEVKTALVRDTFKEKLPEDAKVSVEDEDKINIPNLDGDNKVDVKIKYVVEGVEKTTTIQVPLRTVEGVTQTVPVNKNNEQPDPTKSINRTDYPNDVTFEYKEPVDTRTPGDKNVTVVVRTRDNKTIVEVSAVVRVEKVAGENPAPSEDKKPEEMTPGKEDKKPEEMTPGKENKKPEEMTPGKEDKKPEEMTPGKEDKKPEEMTPGKEDKKPEEMTPGKENKKPEEMTPGKEDKKPEEMTPGKENKKPEEMTPGKEDKKPEEMTPGKENKKPEEMTPGKEDKKPEEMTPGKENKKPEEMTPGKENKKPEEMIPGKENKKPEGMTPGKEDKKPEEMAPGKENKKPEEMTPGKENKKPEEMTPDAGNKPNENKPDGTTPDAGNKSNGNKQDGTTPDAGNKPNENKPDGITPDTGNKPDAGKKEENFNKLKKEALKNINSDDKLTPKEKKDFALLVEKSSAATTFVTKLSDGGEVKVQFDNKNINAKNIKAQLSDVATSEKVRELAKQQLGDKFNVVKTIDLDFVYEKGNIEKKQGDTRTVTVTIGTNSGNEFEVYHLNGNMLEKVPSIYKNGKITFFTNHFSTYTILAKSKEQQNNNSNGKKDNSNGKKDKVNKVDKILPNTGMTISSTIALGLTLMALAILVIRRKFSK